tara:strand:+ start:800 stop:1030 length:231 start_codon:yes stop_codon:yes gene_type:complete
MFEHDVTVGPAKADSSLFDKGSALLTGKTKHHPVQIPYPDQSGTWELITVVPTGEKGEALQYFWKRPRRSVAPSMT